MIALFCEPKNYPMIGLNALAGFSEDKEAERRFTQRFLPGSLSCLAALLCFGACIVIPICTQKRAEDAVPHVYIILAAAFFVLSVGFFIATWRRMVREAPVSPRSGKPMEVYQLENTVKESKYELVYLCRQSRTYFRMVFKEPCD
jgi:hypothetical protein